MIECMSVSGRQEGARKAFPDTKWILHNSVPASNWRARTIRRGNADGRLGVAAKRDQKVRDAAIAFKRWAEMQSGLVITLADPHLAAKYPEYEHRVSKDHRQQDNRTDQQEKLGRGMGRRLPQRDARRH